MKRLLSVCVATALWAVLLPQAHAGDRVGMMSNIRDLTTLNDAQIPLWDKGDGTFPIGVYIYGGSALPVTNAVKQYTGAPSSSTPATTDATVFTLAAGEIGFIQNLSADAPLAVKKGASASTSSFNLILGAGAATDDGKGGYIRIADYVGVVSVAKITGTARYIAWKQAP